MLAQGDSSLVKKLERFLKKLFSKLSLSTNSTKSKSKWMFSTISFLYLHFSFLYLCVSLTMQIMFIHPQMSNFQDLAEESQLDSKLLVLVKYMIPVVILE